MSETSNAAAEVRAAAARQRLSGTLAALQGKLKPRSLIRGATQGLIDAGENLAETSVETVKRHPLKIAGAAAAIGLFLARRPILRLFGRRGDATAAKPARSPKSRSSDRPRAATKRTPR